MKTKIWKLQRPLAYNTPVAEVMAYTEGKTRMALIPMSTEQMDEVFGDELKIYVKAGVKNGNLVVDEIVEEQAW